eukprot:5796253-Amphidinium_carterae.3
MKDRSSTSAVARALVASLIYLLTSRPHLFARHRWTGCDLAIEELLRLQGVSGLLTSAFELYAEKLNKAERKGKVAHGHESAHDEASSKLAWETTTYENSTGVGGQTSVQSDDVGQVEADEKQRSAAMHLQDREKGLTWLQSKPFSHMILMRISMALLVRLLTAQLDMASSSWEQVQQASVAVHLTNGETEFGAGRKFMLGLAAGSVLEKEYFSSLNRLLHGHAEWNLVEEEKHIASFRSLAFSVLARQGCLVYEDLVWRHKQYPCCLFNLLEHPEQADVYAQQPKCTMCDWSKQMLERFNFQGSEFKLVLECHALLGATNTAQIESRRSSIRRMLVTRSAHTWTMPFHVLGAEFMLQGLRRGRVLADKIKAGKIVENTKTLRKRKAQVLDKAEHKDKRVAGLWRAWVRTNTYGSSGRPCLSALAVSYRAAKESNHPALLGLKNLSVAAKQVKLSGKKGGSFGLTSQQLRKHTASERKKKLWERTRKLPTARRAMLLALESEETSTTSLLSMARCQTQLDGLHKKEETCLQMQALRKFEEMLGANQKSILATLGNDKASEAIAYANQTKKSNLGAALEADWLHRHTTIMDENCSKVQEGRPSSACRRAGMCLCSASGRLTQAVHNAFLQLLKQVFGDKIRKQALAHAEVVLHIWCSAQCSSCVGEPQTKMHWWHVGAMSFKPYRPTLLALAVDDREEGLQSGVEHRQALKFKLFKEAAKVLESVPKTVKSTNALSDSKATNVLVDVFPPEATDVFLSSYEACVKLCPACTWSFKPFVLESTMRPLVSFCPGEVSVVPMQGVATEMQLWPKLRRPRQKRAKAKAAHDGTALVPIASAPSLVEEALPLGIELGEQEFDVDEAFENLGSDDEELSLAHQELLLRAEAMEAIDVAIDHAKKGGKGKTESSTSKAEQPLHTDIEAIPDDVIAEPLGPSAIASSSAASTHAPIVLTSAHSDPAAVRSTPVRGVVASASAGIVCPEGKISYHESKRSFEAVCRLHKGCVLTRSADGRKVKGHAEKVGGRPLGFLMAWLEQAEHTSTKAEHWCTTTFNFTYAQRVVARQRLEGFTGATDLLQYEKRKQSVADPDEPLSLLGIYP